MGNYYSQYDIFSPMKHLQDSQILQALNLSKHSIVYIINISSHQGYISPSVEKLLGHPA